MINATFPSSSGISVLLMNTKRVNAIVEGIVSVPFGDIGSSNGSRVYGRRNLKVSVPFGDIGSSNYYPAEVYRQAIWTVSVPFGDIGSSNWISRTQKYCKKQVSVPFGDIGSSNTSYLNATGASRRFPSPSGISVLLMQTGCLD